MGDLKKALISKIAVTGLWRFKMSKCDNISRLNGSTAVSIISLSK